MRMSVRLSRHLRGLIRLEVGMEPEVVAGGLRERLGTGQCIFKRSVAFRHACLFSTKSNT